MAVTAVNPVSSSDEWFGGDGHRVTVLKVLLFYGGMLVALLGTVLIWLFWRPRLIGRVSIDDTNQILRCTLRVARTFKPLRITGIEIPTEYVKALDASPPIGFKEEPRRFIPRYSYDNATRELVEWSGRLEVARGETVELRIPARNPRDISGTLRISYEYLGFGGVAIMATWIYVPFNEPGA